LSFIGYDWGTVTTNSTGTAVVINTPIFISGSSGTGTYQWYPTTGTTTTPFQTIGVTLDKKIYDTGIEYIDYETVYRVKKGGTYKLFDWFIYEKMKLEGRIKEVD